MTERMEDMETRELLHRLIYRAFIEIREEAPIVYRTRKSFTYQICSIICRFSLKETMNHMMRC